MPTFNHIFSYSHKIFQLFQLNIIVTSQGDVTMKHDKSWIAHRFFICHYYCEWSSRKVCVISGIVFTGVFYCLDDFNLSTEEVSYILDTSSENDGNFVYNTNTATCILNLHYIIAQSEFARAIRFLWYVLGVFCFYFNILYSASKHITIQ